MFLILSICLSVGSFALINTVFGGDYRSESPTQAPSSSGLPDRLENSKLNPSLSEVLKRWDAGDIERMGAPEIDGDSRLRETWKLPDSIVFKDLNGELNVAVTIRLGDQLAEFSSWLLQRGITVAYANENNLESYVPIRLLKEIDEHPSVLRIDPISTSKATSVISEGVAGHGVTSWHGAGITGNGTKIGIIDVGFRGFTALQGTELPVSVVANCYPALFEPATSNIADCDRGSNHGTAVAETVIDVAPDTTLYISNYESQSEYFQTVLWMIDQEVDIIVHSGIFAWRGNGDGTAPSPSEFDYVDQAIDAGILWVNAAGNDAAGNWFGAYVDADADGWMEFEPGVELNPIRGVQWILYSIHMRWEDAWGLAARDLDLCVIGPDGVSIIVCTAAVQDGSVGSEPTEYLFEWMAPATATYYYAVIARSFVTPPAWVQLKHQDGFAPDILNTTSTVGVPAESANPGLLAVGGAPHYDTNSIEPYSSRGPTVDGRIKPDIVGIDRGDTVTYGAFAGTSQSAPHVGGLAALVLERFPNMSPVELADYLKSNAEPRGTTPNNDWGWGFAQMTPTPPDAPTSVVAVGGFESASVSWTAGAFDGGSTVTGYTVTSSPGSITADVDGVTLVANVSGLTGFTDYTFTVTATNAAGTSEDSAVSNSVTPTGAGNSLPASVDDSYSVDEDGSLVVIAALGVLDNDSDANGDPMTAAVSTGVSNGSLSLSGDGSFTYTPDSEFNGSDSFTYTASDAEGPGDAATVTITVDAVNDIPSFTVGSDMTVSPEDGAQSITTWISVMSSGPTNESGQVLSFTIGNDDNTLFDVQPSISAAGTLSFTPSASANGVVNVTISIQDDGDTSNGGQNSSSDQFFTITVAPTVGGSMGLQAVSVGGSEFASVAPSIKLVRDGDSFEYNVLVASDGSYSIAGVAAGTYVITVSANGYQSAQRTGEVVASLNVNLGSVQLVPGMVNAGTVIDGADLSLVVSNYGTSTGDRTDGSGNWVDLNADGAVSGQDISSVIANVGVSGMQTWS